MYPVDLWRHAKMFAAVCLLTQTLLLAQTAGAADVKVLQATRPDVSLRNEVDRSLSIAYDYLKKTQNPDGSWSNPEHPALTGLVLTAFLRSPQYAGLNPKPDFIRKGLDFIVASAREDGSIVREKLPNYNTAVCLMALVLANDPQYHPLILKGRRFLAGLQKDDGEKGVADQPLDGGIGYGSKDHSDMSNMVMAIEALKASEFLESDQHLQRYTELQQLEKGTLNWDAALKFIQRCQNLPGSNDQAWASGDPRNRGGFVYFPGNSKAGEETLADGKVALRSYGSMTYAGLLSFIYADLKKDDPRVKAAFDWVQRNYTLEENPGMGQEGLYYYFHTLAKALTVLGEDELVTADGRSVNWRRELTLKLVHLQKGEGFWVNDTGRWWENDPFLTTSYALIALNLAAL